MFSTGMSRRSQQIGLIALLLTISSCAGGGGGGGSSPVIPGSGNQNPPDPPPLGNNFSFTSGDKVGELEIALPTGDSTQGNAFTLHGNLPVPKGVFTGIPGTIWLGVADFDGTIVPAQLERVTRDSNGDPAIFEIIARVHRDSAKQPGTRVSYAVHYLTAPAGESFQTTGPTYNVPQPVQDLLSNTQNLLIVAKDVFGNQYFASPLASSSKKTHREGPFMTTERYYATLTPNPSVQGPQGTLPELLGVHAYVTKWDGENVLGLDLRIHNGMVGSSSATQKPIRPVYFQSIKICVPTGYTALNSLNDLFWNPNGQAYSWSGKNYTAFEIVKPMAAGQMHVMQKQGQTERRLAITEVGNESRAQSLLNQEGLAFCRDGVDASANPLWSWWNPLTANFMQGYTLPNLAFWGAQSLRNYLSSQFNQDKQTYESGVATGVYPWMFPALGWAMPAGIQYQGMTGGTDIFQDNGIKEAYSASVPGVRHAALRLQANTNRQPWALFNPDGSPIEIKQLMKTKTGNIVYIPFKFFMLPEGNTGQDYFLLQEPPNFQENYVSAQGLKPSYEPDLFGFMCHDFQHGIRYSKDALILLFLANDSLAKDDLELTANIARLNEPEVYSCFNNCANALLGAFNFSTAYPGKTSGFFGRGQGWGGVAMVNYYAAADDAWRAGAKAWLDMFVDTAALAQVPCTGFLYSNVSSKSACPTEPSRQHFEQMIQNTLMRGMFKHVYEDSGTPREAALRNVLKESCYSFINSFAWNPGSGPWKFQSVRPNNASQPAYCTPVCSGQLDNYMLLDTLGYGFELTADPTFISKAVEINGGTMAGLKTVLEKTGYPSNLQNNAALLSVMQGLGWVQP